ncbi:ParB-like chromosome segregation protein Spo0J [Paenibacillus wynnii]|nr:ParB-like chromosome segregation protein Spo0J [Paenibacillus wynnii]
MGSGADDLLLTVDLVVGRFGLDTGGEGRTQRDIAKELGISRSYVSRTINLLCVVQILQPHKQVQPRKHLPYD